jgi:hypothetical protein
MDDDTDPTPFGDEITDYVASGDPDELQRWSAPEQTGVPGVDAALGVLAELDELPTADHVAVYDRVHKQLQDALADLDGSRPG